MLPWRPCSVRFRLVDSLVSAATCSAMSLPAPGLELPPIGERAAGGPGGRWALLIVAESCAPAAGCAAWVKQRQNHGPCRASAPERRAAACASKSSDGVRDAGQRWVSGARMPMTREPRSGRAILPRGADAQADGETAMPDSKHFAPPGPLGFGGAPLGNMFEEVTDEVAEATLAAAWDAGIRYFDTAPHYG